MSKNMENFGKFCFGALAVITACLFGGYAFMKLWQWFIVYAFGVQSLNLIQSIGIMFVFGFLKPKKKNDEDLTWDKFIKGFIESLVFILITLALGYLITLFQ